jgi:pyruvate kinase
MTHIITTVGPSSLNKETLDFFANHHVSIARLNCSHNTVDSHIEAGLLARSAGLELLIDLQGPKIRLGEVSQIVEVKKGDIIKLEAVKINQSYPYKQEDRMVFPYEFPVHEFVKQGHLILVDDGKLTFEVQEVKENSVICKVNYGGLVKSRKGMNMPQSDLKVNFLGERDKQFLRGLLPVIHPEYIAASFVKTKSDIDQLKSLVNSIIETEELTGYQPKYCAKLEMGEALEDVNLSEIVNSVDLIMIARGDLALEMLPAHINVPFMQEKIKNTCRIMNKPFIVATQMLESMIENPVPTRAEMSDLYRAVNIDKADYVMLSAESAVGAYPKLCIQLMHDMIEAVELDTFGHNQQSPTKSITQTIPKIYQDIPVKVKSVSL